MFPVFHLDLVQFNRWVAHPQQARDEGCRTCKSWRSCAGQATAIHLMFRLQVVLGFELLTCLSKITQGNE